MEEISEQEKLKQKVNPVIAVLCWIAFFLVWFILIGVQAVSMAL